MAINWARGLDELGTGLLRQADIGNKAYEGAMAKEAEQRAADRELARDMRAAERADKLFEKESTRWVDQQRILHGYGMEKTEKHFQNLLKADEIKYGREEASKREQFRRERYAKIQDAKAAAKNDMAVLAIENNVKRAESADDTADNLQTALAKAIADGETAESDRLSLELEKAELQRTEAWARIPGMKPLTSRQQPEIDLFAELGGTLADKIALQIGDKNYVNVLLAIKDGDKDSSDYQAAITTMDNALEKIFEQNPVLNKYRGAKKRRLRKHLLEKTLVARSKSVTQEDVTRTDVADPPKDEGNGVVSEAFSGDPAYQAGVGFGKIIGEVIESFKGLDDMGIQIQGSAIGKRIAQWETEEGLKPQEIIARIKERVTGGPEGEKIVWQMFLERLDPNQGAMLESPGRINPRGGMIFEADQMNMSPTAVDARYV